MNYYAILNLSNGATVEEIKKAHRKLAMQYHPDHCPGDPTASEKFKQIQMAYEFLINNSHCSKKPQQRQQKPVLKHENFKIYEASPPKYDLWGNLLTTEDQQDWIHNNAKSIKEVNANKPSSNRSSPGFIDIFANKYENESVPDIR